MIDCGKDWNEGIAEPSGKDFSRRDKFFFLHLHMYICMCVHKYTYEHWIGGVGGFGRWTAIGNWRNA